VERADSAPTVQTYDVFNYLDHELQQQITQWNTIMNSEVPALNKAVRDKDIPFISTTSKTTTGEN
jgi:hypothetical protein